MWPYLAFLLLFSVTMLFGVWAKERARIVFQEHVSGGLKEPMTGALAADAICRAAHAGVMVQSGGRYLSLHYDPSSRTLSLDPFTYDGRSITSIGKGIYEAGHVLQQRQCYRWFRLRPGTVPYNHFAARKFGLICLAGIILQLVSLRAMGDSHYVSGGGLDRFSEGVASVSGFLADGAFLAAALVFLLVLAAQLAALWVGIDASKRAAATLARADFSTSASEREDLTRVIRAAPWAYVGTALTALMGIPNRQAMEPSIEVNPRSSVVHFDFYF